MQRRILTAAALGLVMAPTRTLMSSYADAALLTQFQSLPKTDRMPVFFVGHGSPMNAIGDNEYRRSWQALGAEFGTK